MARLARLQDVVDWGLCIGCGACVYLCGEGSAELVNRPAQGLQARFRPDGRTGSREALAACPGFQVDARRAPGAVYRPPPSGRRREQVLVGPTLEIWEGHAADPQVRRLGSSGGLLTALALHCLKKEGMSFVLHTAMDPQRPWLNRTVRSRRRAELLRAAGARFAGSSPCEALAAIEAADRPCLFIGKPCDTWAVREIRRRNPRLDARLGAVFTFFCAGVPSSRGTLELIDRLGVGLGEVRGVRYRGEGWPGSFRVELGDGTSRSLTYLESWSSLRRNRPLRCYLCPDGLGELADLSFGDAWHRYDEEDPGRSLVLVRSERGRRILMSAAEAGVVRLHPSGLEAVLASQGLVRRRRRLFGRLLVRRLLLLPAPRYRGFRLYRGWRLSPLSTRLGDLLEAARSLRRRRRPRRADRPEVGSPWWSRLRVGRRVP